jgi:hypothetical protein
MPGPAVPDSVDPVELHRLLELRECGPRSSVMPAIDFSKANHPGDLSLAVQMLIRSTAGPGDPKGMTMAQAANTACFLIHCMTKGIEERMTAERPVPLSKEWQIQLSTLSTLALAFDMVSSLAAPLNQSWMQDHPEIVPPDATSEQRRSAMVSDALLEALQIPRSDLEFADQGPSRDS